MKNLTTTTLKLFGAAALTATLATDANAATFNWIGGTVGGSNPFSDGDNWDTGVSAMNNVADTLNITSGGVNDTGNNFVLIDNPDTVNVSNGGFIRVNKNGNRLLRPDGGGGSSPRPVVNVLDGGTIQAPNFNTLEINVSGTGQIITGSNGDGNVQAAFQNGTTVTFDAGWTGSIFFQEYTTTAAVLDFIDNSAPGVFFVSGDATAFTSADLGSKFLLEVIDADSGDAPAFAKHGGVNANGVYLTLIPEPSSLALLAMGGLMIARRRRG